MPARRTAVVLAALLIAEFGAASLALPQANAAPAANPHDFDGDGTDQFAFAGTDVDGLALVFASGGIDTPGGFDVLVPPGVDEADTSTPAFAAGDFNGDGYGDLAVGYPDAISEGSTTSVLGGSVVVFVGSTIGLDFAGPTAALLSQDTPGVPGAAETGDHCGAALVAGDFDTDGYDDLVVGCPDEDIGTLRDAGSAFLIPGGPGALGIGRAASLYQGSPSMYSSVEAKDRFGASLAAGDVTGDKRDDLAVGSPGEGAGTSTTSHDWGLLHLIPGSTTGLSTSRSTYSWSQNIGNNTTGQYWPQELGTSLALGDLNKDGRLDLIAGAPTSQSGPTNAGAIVAYLGSSKGLAVTPKVLTQSSSGIPGSSEYADRWGTSVAAGDITGDGFADVVVGAPGEDVGSVIDAGAYTVIRGSAAGLVSAGSFGVTQATPYVDGVVTEYHRFSAQLTLSDLDEDGRLDVVVGIASDDVGIDVLPGGRIEMLVSTSTGRPSAASTSGTASDAAGDGQPHDFALLGTAVG